MCNIYRCFSGAEHSVLQIYTAYVTIKKCRSFFSNALQQPKAKQVLILQRLGKN